MALDNWIDKTLKSCRPANAETEIQSKLIAKSAKVYFENQYLSANTMRLFRRLKLAVGYNFSRRFRFEY